MGITITSSTCGPIIQPSIMMVVFGVAVGCSIGGLFMAGIIPGLLIGFPLLIRDRKHHFPRRKGGYTKEERRRIIKAGLLPPSTPIVMFGGSTGGVFTATEAGAAAVFYSLIVRLFIGCKIADIPVERGVKRENRRTIVTENV